MEMKYLCQPPKKWTFEQPKLKEWVENWCEPKRGRYVLNLFAGKIRLNVAEVRVDISPEFRPDYCISAEQFIKSCITEGVKFHTIILDPPYNLRKAREKYDGKYIGSFTKIKNLLPDILYPKGRVITLGYDTVGMSKSRGFEKIAVCIVCHGGDHNDTLCLVERKV